MKHQRLKHVAPLPTNFSPKTVAIVERAQTPSVGECIVFVHQGKFVEDVYAKSCRNNTSTACQTTHVCAPTEAYFISNHTGNAFAFALLLRKPRLGWAGRGAKFNFRGARQ